MRNKPVHTRPAVRMLAAALFAAALFCSCSNVEKFLTGEDKVLERNIYDIKTPDGGEPPKEIRDALSNIKNVTRQKPNSHILGFGPRLTMHIYCLSNPAKNKKSNFIHSYLRRKGQEPVVYDEDAAVESCAQIADLLDVKGCFRSEVTFDTTWKNKYDVVVTYHIRPTERYRIKETTFHAETPEVDSLLKVWSNESLLVEGDYYDQDKMNEERTRIVTNLRNEGYYYATTDLISYLVDTAFDDHRLTIRLDVRNPKMARHDKLVFPVPLRKYTIDNIYVYPNSSASNANAATEFDTLVVSRTFRNRTSDYIYLYNQPMTLKPEVINNSISLFKGQTYRPSSKERTYNHLLGMRNFKYINIEFAESPNSNDTTPLLNAKVRLLTAKRQRFSISLEVNNSSSFEKENFSLMNGNLGLETKANYQNKNLFGGAEIFNTELSFLVELPKMAFKNLDGELKDNVSNFENGLNFSIDLPTFLFPFTKNIEWQRMRPHTVISLGGNYQKRYNYFNRLLFNTSFGYNWSRNRNGHQMIPLELTYSRFFDKESALIDRLANSNDPRLTYRYSDHFIMDARYDYTYNSQQYGVREGFNYLHLSIESAGNLLSALASFLGSPKDSLGVYQIFGVPYSQYLRFNAEYKHYFFVGNKSTFVTRLLAGVGLPYGNSTAMPFEKGFYGGGNTTMRAWPLRQLGPGSYQDTIGGLERFGDIQLVANLEYRFPIISFIEGALFTDIGNVWLAHESEEYQGGKFSFKDLYKSIATDIGLGIRFNISILTLRMDFALPLYDPGKPSDIRWRPTHWSFRDIQGNFGIDYPF